MKKETNPSTTQPEAVRLAELMKQKKLLIAFGIIPKPKKAKKAKVVSGARKRPFPDRPHAPVGFPCQVCKKSINILHVGTQTDKDNPIDPITLANDKAMAEMKKKGFLNAHGFKIAYLTDPRQYWTKENTWSTNKGEARPFASAKEAAEFATKHLIDGQYKDSINWMIGIDILNPSWRLI